VKDFQQHLLALVSEIDQACAKENIRYALYGETAAYANVNHGFTGNQCKLHLMMRAKDMVKLKKSMERKLPANRAFEGLKENPKLSFNELRYVDTGTTFALYSDRTEFNELGMAVIIHPMFASAPSNWDQTVEPVMIYLHGGAEYNYHFMNPKRKKAMDTCENVERLLGPKAIASRRLKRLKDDAKASGDTLYYLRTPQDLVKMPASYLTKTQRIPFETLELPVSVDVKKYVNKHYGRNWKPSAKGPVSADRSTCILTADVPFAEALELMKAEGVDFRDIQRRNSALNLLYCRTVKKWDRVCSEDFALARMSQARIDLFVEYEGKRAELTRASEENDLDTAKLLLGPYFNLTREFLERNKGFYVDEQSFDLAKRIWHRSGRDEYAKRVESLIPPEFRDCDLSETLAEYLK
jgi:phosphorylcholine metabolism protein LicD